MKIDMKSLTIGILLTLVVVLAKSLTYAIL